MMMRRAEQPDQPVTWPGWEHSIQYAMMEIGETQLMGSDVPPDRFQPMRSVYLSLTVNGAQEAERIYKLLADGGQVFMAMEETFFAVRFGQLREESEHPDDPRFEATDSVTAGDKVQNSPDSKFKAWVLNPSATLRVHPEQRRRMNWRVSAPLTCI